MRYKWRRIIINHSKEDSQIVTGHTNLKRHRYLMDMEDNSLCHGCGVEETAIHLITECAVDVGLGTVTKANNRGGKYRRISNIQDT